MRSLKLKLPMVAALAAAVLMFTPAESSAISKKGALVGGLVVGAAVGAAVAADARHKTKIIVPGYAPPYPPGGYPPYYQQVTSPKPGILCYPAQRACYNAGGAYNPKWTMRTFGVLR